MMPPRRTTITTIAEVAIRAGSRRLLHRCNGRTSTPTPRSSIPKTNVTITVAGMMTVDELKVRCSRPNRSRCSFCHDNHRGIPAAMRSAAAT